MTRKQFCERYNITEDQFYGRGKIGGSLYLGSLTSIPEGFNPTVGGSLYLGSLTSIPEGFNPTVGGYLNLGSLTSIPEGFNPTVGGSLDLGSLTSIPEGFNPTVGGYLDLGSLTSIPEGFNPTVGGSLDLGSLDLGSLTSIPEGFNPTVGGYLYLGSLDKKLRDCVKVNTTPAVIQWKDYKYISVDGIFCEVVGRKGMIYKCKKIGNDESFYVVVVDGKASHGKTIKEAKEDLLYKIASHDKSKYEGMKKSDTLTHAEAIEMYRVITGACAFGTKDYVENRLPERKAKYLVSEIIELTKGEYGNQALAEFFKS